MVAMKLSSYATVGNLRPDVFLSGNDREASKKQRCFWIRRQKAPGQSPCPGAFFQFLPLLAQVLEACSITISTRRFCCRPVESLLLEIGLAIPKPTDDIRVEAIPC